MAQIDELYAQVAENILTRGYFYNDGKRDKVCQQLSLISVNIPVVKEVSFPVLTTKKMFTKGIVAELLWFLRGDSNIKFLVDNNVNIWNKDAYNWYLKNSVKKGQKDIVTFIDYVKEGIDFDDECHENYRFGDVGRNYGTQWVNWQSVKAEAQFNELSETKSTNQIKNLLENMVSVPFSRRHIVTAWNPGEIGDTALPSCHWSWEVIVHPIEIEERFAISKNEEYLKPLFNNGSVESFKEIERLLDLEDTPKYGFSLKWHQRSVDIFLGLPFNIVSYALLARFIQACTNFDAYMIVGDLSNVHFYEPHIPIVKEQLERNPKTHKGCNFDFSDSAKASFLSFRKKEITLEELLADLKIEDFVFTNYTSFEALSAEMFEPKSL